MTEELGTLSSIYNREKIQLLDIKRLLHSYETFDSYTIVSCRPATGILFITEDNPGFISGQVRMRGKSQGRYPFNYLEMIDNIFGYELNTIEVCSRSVPGINKGGCCFTVDINPVCYPDLVADGQTLDGIQDNKFKRWRCDPRTMKLQLKRCMVRLFLKQTDCYKPVRGYANPGHSCFCYLESVGRRITNRVRLE